jgi:tRNA A37 threonylcarbamoyltransferase TsaD
LLADLAAAFQQAVADVLVEKTADAALATGARQVCICGGVSANRMLRDTAAARLDALGIPLYIPPLRYCTDNAAMIGAAAYYRWRSQPLPDGLAMDVHASLPLPEEESDSGQQVAASGVMAPWSAASGVTGPAGRRLRRDKAVSPPRRRQ